MQSTQSRPKNNSFRAGSSLRRTPVRCLFLQTEMGAVFVVVPNVLEEEPFQVALAECNHMIQKITTAASHPALRYPVLPGAPERCSDWLAAQCSHRRQHVWVELRIPIKDQIFGRSLVRERLAQLLRDPRAGRVPGDIEVQNASAVMGNDEEAIQDAERDGRDGEEVHCRNSFPMILEKCSPALGRLRVPPCTLNPTRNGPFGDIEPEHLQFAVDARSTPCGIFRHHLEDQLAHFSADRFPSRLNSVAGNPLPVKAKPSAMPADHSFRRDDKENVSPPGPEASSQDPEELVGRRQLRSGSPRLEDGQLLTQGQILQHQAAPGVQQAGERPAKQAEEVEHGGVLAEVSSLLSFARAVVSKADQNHGKLCPLKVHDREVWDKLKMANIGGGYAVVQFQSGYADQQIRERKTNTFCLILAVDLSGAKRHGHRNRMDGYGQEQFLNKLLSLRSSRRRVGAGRAMGQFQQRDDRDRNIRLTHAVRDGREHLPRILALTLGRDQNAGVEDQSHAGGSSGSRWLSTAAWTSLAKSASMVAADSSGRSAMHSEMDRRGGNGA